MKKVLYAILASTLLFSSCSDSFFDINDNPNEAVEENMTPSLVLPRAQHRLAETSAIDYDTYLRWMGYAARCAGTYGPNTEEETYAITSSFNRTSWLEMYDILKDIDVIEKNAETRGESGYRGIAKILKTIGFMQLVDQYNNVPYSKAFDLAENMLTPYDNGQTIYEDLIVQLAQADTLLANTQLSENLDIEKADLIFGGDFEMWRKLANSQRLRLVMHQSELLGDAGIKTEIDKIVANGAGFLGEGETAEVQPGYSTDVYKQNPYWNAFNINDNGGLDNYNRANNYFLDLLRTNQDIRYQYFYSEAATPTDGELYVGFDYGFDYPENTPEDDKKAAANSSNIAGPGIAKSATMAQWLFTSFESMFLQAEAIQRGALAGDAQEMYEAAVTESFSWLEVEDAETTADTYLNSTLNSFAVWGENSDKLELILTQKYIAMFGINGLETWTDYRRTGIPDVPLSISPGLGSRVIPTRLIYPLEEYQYNSANALNEGTINPQSSTIFWDK